jgi:hypothetical protein
MSATHTFMVNPETKGEWRCPNALVDIYEKRGWKKAKDPEDVADAVSAPPAPVADDVEPTAFDPAGQKVKDVLAYIDPLRDSHPGEVARVLLLERQGENRPSITGDTATEKE